MGPNQPPIQCLPRIFTWVNRPGCECDHTLLSTADVKYGAIPLRPLYLHHAYRTTLSLNFVFVIISVNVVIVFTTARNVSLRRATLIQSSTLYRIHLTFGHRSFTFNSNKSPTRCNNFSVYYPNVCLQFNMFRAFSLPSSGAQ